MVLSRNLCWRSMLQDLMRQASIGGGQGMSLRTYGLACDQLTGLTMVDYQGNVIQASSTQNQDLLWASCGGGGGNLGIVTSFTIKTNSLSSVPYVTTAVINWVGYSSAAQIFDKASLRTIQCGWNKSKLQTQISDSWVNELCTNKECNFNGSHTSLFVLSRTLYLSVFEVQRRNIILVSSALFSCLMTIL